MSDYSKRLVAFERKGRRALRVFILDTQFLVLPEEMRLIRKASKLPLRAVASLESA
jgi:hypothetical protein